jgi:hypothetical protein
MIALLPKLGAQTHLKEVEILGKSSGNNLEIILASLPSSVNKLYF